MVFRSMYRPECVFVTASTGLAACSIGGTTIHSFAGIGLGVEEKEVLLEKVSSRKEVRVRWQTTKALVIDEISMVDADLFVSSSSGVVLLNKLLPLS